MVSVTTLCRQSNWASRLWEPDLSGDCLGCSYLGESDSLGQCSPRAFDDTRFSHSDLAVLGCTVQCPFYNTFSGGEFPPSQQPVQTRHQPKRRWEAQRSSLALPSFPCLRVLKKRIGSSGSLTSSGFTGYKVRPQISLADFLGFGILPCHIHFSSHLPWVWACTWVVFCHGIPPPPSLHLSFQLTCAHADVPCRISRCILPFVVTLGFRPVLRPLGPSVLGQTTLGISVVVRAPNTCIGGSGTRAVRRPDVSVDSCAPNTRIGGSGTRASCDHTDAFPPGALDVAHPSDEGWLTRCFDGVGLPLATFARSTVFMVFLALVRLLTHPLRLGKWTLGRAVRAPFAGQYGKIVCSLGAVASPQPVLDWKSTSKPRRALSSSKGLRVWVSLLSWLAVPSPLPLHIVAYSTWVLTPACAMTRPETAADGGITPPMAHAPHLLRPDELTSHVGVCDAGPDTEPPPPRHAEYWSESRLVEARAMQTQSEQGGWLGVTVYTPHYRTVSFAIQCGATPDAQRAIDLVTESHLGVPRGLFDTVVPIRPQPNHGYGTFVRFSSNIRGLGGGEGMAAVVADLTRAGGPYFATILPKHLPYDDLCAYLGPLTQHTAATLCLYIGCRTKPWPSCAMVQLQDGDVITVTSEHSRDFERIRFVDLFQDGAIFGSLQHMPVPVVRESTCALYRDKRYCFSNSSHPGRTVVQRVLEELQLDPNDVQMCSFPITDLEVQGELCTFVIAVQDSPRPTTWEVQQIPVRHTFVLLDFRPLGLKPRFLYTTFPALHVPSLASKYEIVLSPARKLGVLGGRRVREDVYVDGNCTLVFFAEDIANESPYDDSTSEQLPSPPLEDPSGPPGVVVEVDSPAYAAEEATDAHMWESQWTPNEARIPAGGISEALLSTSALRPDHEWIPDGPPPWDAPASTTQPCDSVWEDGCWDANATTHSADGPQDDVGDLVSVPMATIAPAAVAHSIPDQALLDTSSGTSQTQITVFVAVPDYLPEYYTVSLDTPCSVDTMLSALRRCRNARNWGTPTCFGNVAPVCPQPLSNSVVLVGYPVWMPDSVVAFMDCRNVDLRAFAVVVGARLNRESLLIAAGFPWDATHHVYVHGLLQPLAQAQVISLFPGIMISFAIVGQGPPDVHDLATMLQSSQGWDRTANLPSPRWCRGSHY